MSLLEPLLRLLRIGHAREIMRRYFVVNGFDGTLTMLGIIMGFRIGGDVELFTILHACLGAAVALGVSGMSSAYISESAERHRALRELERAMIVDLSATDHGAAARVTPIAIALINGLSPLLLSGLIILPLALAAAGLETRFDPLALALAMAFVVIFVLGAYLGRLSGRFWLLAGGRAVLVAAATAAIIYLIGG
jgi:predicted membrane protein (TIGR00267 family)